MVKIKDVLKKLKKETGCNYRCKGFNNYLKGDNKKIDKAMEQIPAFIREQSSDEEIEGKDIMIKSLNSDNRQGYRLFVESDRGSMSVVAVFYID